MNNKPDHNAQNHLNQIDPRIQLVVKKKDSNQLNTKTVKYKVDTSVKNGHHSNKSDMEKKRRRIIEEGQLIRKHKGKAEDQGRKGKWRKRTWAKKFRANRSK